MFLPYESESPGVSIQINFDYEFLQKSYLIVVFLVTDSIIDPTMNSFFYSNCVTY
jgi:hypothetical protein